MASVRFVAACGDTRVDGLLCGAAWGGEVVSFSAPGRAFDFGVGYVSDTDGDGRSAQDEGFAAATAQQRAALSAVLEGGNAAVSVEGFTRLDLRDVGANGVGDVRLANTSDATTAYAYEPGSGVGGDVWLGRSGAAPRAGNYDQLVLLHELGHALGLKHAHETEDAGPVPRAWDSPEFTVMTYRPYAGGPVSGYRFEDWGAPQSFMMLDIAALQHLYGADYTANAGDTVYRWTPGSGRTLIDGEVAIDPGGNRIFATIWDGGGQDTYDLSAYRTGLRLDLRPGEASIFSEAQRADLGGGPDGGLARGNVFNALQHRGDARSLIEDAVGGAGADRIAGNAAANQLWGGGGRDTLSGLAGQDRLCGGLGADVFRFGSAKDSPYKGADLIVAGGGAAAFQGAGRAGGDVIHLGAIDADVRAGGDQDFRFGASKARGHLWVEERGAVTYVCGNVDRDAAPELQIALRDWGVRASDYTTDDFVL